VQAFKETGFWLGKSMGSDSIDFEFLSFPRSSGAYPRGCKSLFKIVVQAFKETGFWLHALLRCFGTLER